MATGAGFGATGPSSVPNQFGFSPQSNPATMTLSGAG
jgi:hypothetical protein